MKLSREFHSDVWRCLVVDDEVELREILSEYISELPADFEVDTSADGDVALELCLKHHYDIIICDIKMPHMDGIAFLKELRKRKITSPFVVVTGYGDRDSILSALKNDAYDFIFKPFYYEQIESCLNGILTYLEHKASVEGQIKFILKDQGLPDPLIKEIFEFNDSILKERYASLSKQMQSIA